MVRVRFAPSPTGYLHVGSARTALYNWLFARNKNGKLILRIEDTDITRSKKKYLDEILDSLAWLNLRWDEGPYFQTKRLDIYTEHAEKLLQEGKAYYESEGSESRAVRFKVPPETVRIDDLVHGPIEFDNSLLEDFVILKSDGMPTYNFACVVDDVTMRITHVIRGDDHIPNTPKQLALYEAFGYEIPDFAHIPLILGEDRSRLSKRHGATSINEYRKKGFLPNAIVNFLALLGWSPGENREILPIGEMIKEFSLQKVNKTSAVFNIEKLMWMNGQYIKKMPPENLLSAIEPLLVRKRLLKKSFDKEWLLELIKLYQGRMKLVSDFPTLTDYFFVRKVRFDEEAFEKILMKNDAVDKLSLLEKKLEGVSSLDSETAEESTRNLAKELGIPAAELIHPTRVALTGRMVSPGLFDVMALLGKENVLKRLKQAIKLVKKRTGQK